jgi:hypothetical protein
MTDPAFEALARRNRELEALNAVSATIGRGGDLESTAGDALDVVLGLTGMRVGCVFARIPRSTDSSSSRIAVSTWPTRSRWACGRCRGPTWGRR